MTGDEGLLKMLHRTTEEFYMSTEIHIQHRILIKYIKIYENKNKSEKFETSIF